MTRRCRSWTINNPPRDIRLSALGQYLVHGRPGAHVVCHLLAGHDVKHRHVNGLTWGPEPVRAPEAAR